MVAGRTRARDGEALGLVREPSSARLLVRRRSVLTEQVAVRGARRRGRRESRRARSEWSTWGSGCQSLFGRRTSDRSCLLRSVELRHTRCLSEGLESPGESNVVRPPVLHPLEPPLSARRMTGRVWPRHGRFDGRYNAWLRTIDVAVTLRRRGGAGRRRGSQPRRQAVLVAHQSARPRPCSAAVAWCCHVALEELC